MYFHAPLFSCILERTAMTNRIEGETLRKVEWHRRLLYFIFIYLFFGGGAGGGVSPDYDSASHTNLNSSGGNEPLRVIRLMPHSE